jgi:type II secretion system protein C
LYIRKVLFVFKLALVLVLCIIVIRTVIIPQHPAEIFQPASAAGTENVSTKGAESTIETSIEDYSALASQNIFGVTEISDSEEKSSYVDEPDDVVILAGEELSLELVGTVCGIRSVSRAIIKNTKNKKLGMYKTGQNIAGAHIKSIEENSVILVHNGQRKMLRLNRAGENHKNNTQLLSPPVMSKTGKAASSVLAVEQSLVEIPSKIEHLEVILNEAAIEPYLVEGRVEGLRITDLDKIPRAEAFGLKEGDIVSRVNGHRLTSKQQAFQVFKKAKSEATISLELLSRGETRDLSFTLH